MLQWKVAKKIWSNISCFKVTVWIVKVAHINIGIKNWNIFNAISWQLPIHYLILFKTIEKLSILKSCCKINVQCKKYPYLTTVQWSLSFEALINQMCYIEL